MDSETEENSGQTARVVRAGDDSSGAYRGLGISSIDFKLAGEDRPELLIIENKFRARGGPPRHRHFFQDEWFFALEGTFDFEVGAERLVLNPGDSVFAPRGVPHVWAFVGEAQGRILIVFSPAGKMAAFFDTVNRANAMPPQDPELWLAHDMELLGPPLLMR